VLHVRLTELDAEHQNQTFPPNRSLPLKQYQYQVTRGCAHAPPSGENF